MTAFLTSDDTFGNLDLIRSLLKVMQIYLKFQVQITKIGLCKTFDDYIIVLLLPDVKTSAHRAITGQRKIIIVIMY